MAPMGGHREETGAAMEGRGDTLPLRPMPHSAVDIEESLIPPNPDSEDGDGKRSRDWNPQRHKTFLAFFVILLSGFFNFFLLTIIHDVVPRQPLPDLVFMLVEQQAWAMPVGDVTVAVSIAVTFSLILLHKYRWLIYRRLFLLAGFLYGLRACVLAVTFIPPSFANHSAICFPPEERVELWSILGRFRDYVLTLGLTSKQGKILCGDLMFSGHTISLSLMYFVVVRYSPRRAWLLRWVMCPVAYFGMATMVLSGGHYTMDVLIGYWLSSNMFWAYHAVFEGPEAGRERSPLSWMWWFWVAAWFEADTGVTGRLENRLEWPLPWPAIAVDTVDRLSRTLNAKDGRPPHNLSQASQLSSAPQPPPASQPSAQPQIPR